MKKCICLSLLVCFLSLSAFSQMTGTIEERTTKAAEEYKTVLQSTLGLSSTAADNIISIEADFYKGITAVRAKTALSLKDREIQEHQLHVTRREKLIATPLTPRQMEDVIDAGSAIRSKYKL